MKTILIANQKGGCGKTCESVKVIQPDMERKRQCTAETLGSDPVQR